MKHDPEIIEKVARAIILRTEAPWSYHDLAQAALDAAFQWRECPRCEGSGEVPDYEYGPDGKGPVILKGSVPCPRCTITEGERDE